MKFTIFLTITMVIFSTIEVQGNEDQGADNRKTWFGEKMDAVLKGINKKRDRSGKERVTWGNGKNSIKTKILESANLRNLFKNDFNRNQPLNIIGTELAGMPYQLEVTLVGSSYTKKAQYEGRYTLDVNEKKNGRHVWVKKSGRRAIWSKKENEGTANPTTYWRIGSINEKDTNSDSTAFRMNGFGEIPILETGGHWEYRLRNNEYKSDGKNHEIIRIVDKMIDASSSIDLLFNGRPNLQRQVTDFKKAFQGLIDGTDAVVTCIQTYNNFGGNGRRTPGKGYNCGNKIGEPGTPCGGSKLDNGVIPINHLAWLRQILGNQAQEILKSWISNNTPEIGMPHDSKGTGKVQLSTSAIINGDIGGSLNTKDQVRNGEDLKAHFYFPGIRA